MKVNEFKNWTISGDFYCNNTHTHITSFSHFGEKFLAKFFQLENAVHLWNVCFLGFGVVLQNRSTRIPNIIPRQFDHYSPSLMGQHQSPMPPQVGLHHHVMWLPLSWWVLALKMKDAYLQEHVTHVSPPPTCKVLSPSQMLPQYTVQPGRELAPDTSPEEFVV